MFDERLFYKRLAELRILKGVSARDMSLSIGQSENYINAIENGRNFPSMQVFFYICDYLGVTPSEFFNMDSAAPALASSVKEKLDGLNGEQLALIDKMIDNMK